MKRIPTLLSAILSLSLLLASCSNPASLSASRGVAPAPLRATLVAGASGQSLRVLQPSQLPEGLRDATEIRAILDNSNSTYPVIRNADGSLSIPLPAGRQPDSAGIIELLLTDGRSRSWLVRFNTGPLLALAATPIQVGPSNRIVLGTALTLEAKFADSPSTTDYVFAWSAATAAAGPFAPISGTGPRISWEPTAAGNYFIRLETRDKLTGATSTYTTPAAQVFVSAPDAIAITEPAGGRILAGDEVRLRANVSEFPTAAWLWSYSQSPVGPFAPIAGSGNSLSWEPPAAGSYYLRLQARIEGQDQVYTSTRPLVFVSVADEVISTDPPSGEVIRGLAVGLTATVPDADPAARYLWSFASSPQGAFQAISSEGRSISWLPESTGEFYLRVRTVAPNGDEKTYTSSEVLVSVRDSDDRFIVTPSPANLVRGQSVLLGLREVANDRTINWFWAPSPQGPFVAIAGQGQNVRWTPPQAGTFYLRAEVTGGDAPKSTYTSATALVSVSEATGVISASPEGSIAMGKPVTLSANLPEAPAGSSYTWSVGPSPAGPWQPAQSLDADPRGQRLTWYPGAAGNYFVKADLTRPDGQVLSFVSPRALVFVAGSREFFSTNPAPAVIGTQGAVTLNAGFVPPGPGTYTYAWSSAPSPQGPFTALGASLSSRFSWTQPGTPGNYYLKLDLIGPNSRALSFLSSEALVFVGESTSSPGGLPPGFSF